MGQLIFETMRAARARRLVVFTLAVLAAWFMFAPANHTAQPAMQSSKAADKISVATKVPLPTPAPGPSVLDACMKRRISAAGANGTLASMERANARGAPYPPYSLRFQEMRRMFYTPRGISFSVRL